MKFLSKHQSVIKFLIAGALTFGVDYVALVGCYYLFHFPLWLATSIGYVAGLCVSFYLNRKWVYGDRGRQRRAARQLVEYAILLVFNYFFTIFAIQLLDNLSIPPSVSKLGVTVIIVCWNYVIYSKIIFRGDSETTA